MENPFELFQAQLNRIERLLTQVINQGLISPKPEIEMPIGIEEATQLLNLSRSRIYQNPDIPRHKRNGRLHFFESEILDYIRNGPKQPVVEVDKPYKRRTRKAQPK